MEDKRLYMLGVMIEKRNAEAPEVQKVFTKYGDCILSRLGIHECADTRGLISINAKADESYVKSFADELTSLEGVSVKYMELE